MICSEFFEAFADFAPFARHRFEAKGDRTFFEPGIGVIDPFGHRLQTFFEAAKPVALPGWKTRRRSQKRPLRTN
jgi:hypothetical protein